MALRMLILLSTLLFPFTSTAAPFCAVRHTSTVRAFQRLHPCPSTGRTRGACPGWVADHRIALACGGPDTPTNLQWQMTAEGKAKDKWERKGCAPCRKSR